jgi:predicted ATPase
MYLIPAAVKTILEFSENYATVPGLIEAVKSAAPAADPKKMSTADPKKMSTAEILAAARAGTPKGVTPKFGVVPFVGAGLTANLGLRTWRDFLKAQCERLGLHPDGSPDELLDSIQKSAGALFIADALKMEYGDHRFSRPIQGPLRCIPYLTQNLTVTTNLNRALELAFEDASTPFDRIESTFSENVPGPIHPSRSVLLKLHGCVLDVRNATLKMSDFEEQLNSARRLRKDLQDIAANRTLLFLGTTPSGKLLEVIGEASKRNGRSSHYALISNHHWKDELIRSLYLNNIRPVWYPMEGDALEDFLVYLIHQMPSPPNGLPAPRSSSTSSAKTDEPKPAKKAASGASSDVILPPSIPKDLVDSCLKGECVAFIGSGLSARAGLPTWRRFVDGMIQFAVDSKVMTQQHAELQREALEGGDVNAVADNTVNAFGKERELVLDYCRDVFTTENALPKAFQSISAIPFGGILTSNLDNLLERTFAGTEVRTGLTPRDSEKLLDLLSAGKTPYLLKLYGDLDQPDSVILAPTEYQQLVKGNVAFARFIEALFFSRTLLFIGTSLEGLTDYLSVFTFPSGVTRQHYALVAVQGRRWRATAESLKRRYNIEVIPFSLAGDFAELDTFLVRLAEATGVPREAPIPLTGTASKPQLQRVILKNIGPFRELDLALDNNWKILLGDNGVGKSTILKSIAAAIVGSEARHSAGRLLRVDQPLGSVTLITAKNPSGYVTEFQRVGAGAEVMSRSGRPLESEGWLALGFPPLRMASWNPSVGPQGMGKKHPAAEDVLPLVHGETDSRMDDLKQWLVNTEAMSRKEGASPVDRAQAAEILEKFFAIVGELTEGLEVRFKEITRDFRVMVKTPDGDVPVESLSQGMTSLLSWVGILLQRLYEIHYGDPDVSDPTQEYALVLMDEIDAHMHPAWQQALVGKLKKLFPKIQVLASTHSPLVVGGMPVDQVVRFVRSPSGEVTMAHIDEDMTLGRADQILTGDLFGLPTTLALDDKTHNQLQEYEELLAISEKSPAQQERFYELHAILASSIPSSDETKLERRAHDLALAVLKADYETNNVAALKTTLLSKVKEVGKSLGWADIL